MSASAYDYPTVSILPKIKAIVLGMPFCNEYLRFLVSCVSYRDCIASFLS